MNKDNPEVVDLELIYRETLRRCAPDVLVQRVASTAMPRHVVAIGKCAGPLLDGFAAAVPVESAFVAVPRGYPPPRLAEASADLVVMTGGHPEIDQDSFAAGEALLRYVDSHQEITFLISGGGSACVEVPLRPFFTEEDVTATNRRLLRGGIPIGEINAVRKHLSAIKGGRLAARVQDRAVTLVYSDVGPGDLGSVASGPTMPDRSTASDAIGVLTRIGECDRIVTVLRDQPVPPTVTDIGDDVALLVADNDTLVATAAMLVGEAGLKPVRRPGQIESEVESAARELARQASSLERGEVLVVGGEPTIVVRGNGRGGRCLDLAVRFAVELSNAGSDTPVDAVFASSDGVDGNSGVAGVSVSLPQRFDVAAAEAALARSDSLSAAGKIGRPIIIPPTGNNLRDLYLVARG